MHDVHMTLDELDLNLLRTLDVLLEERSVTRAARILGRSQPAVSHALGRLRESLGDPLLVRQGRGLERTPRAEALAGPIHHLLGELRRAVELPPEFDPLHSERHFRLAAPDILGPLLPEILAALGVAPGVRLEFLNARGSDATREADVVLDVLPDEAPGVVAVRLGGLEQAVVARVGHPAVENWGMEAWLAHRHVVVRTPERSLSIVDRVLAEQGLQRKVGFYAPDLLLVPHVVAQTDLLFMGPSRVLAPLCQPLGLVLLESPLQLPVVPVAAMWAERLAQDPGHKWFRGQVVDVIRGIFAVSGRDS